MLKFKKGTFCTKYATVWNEIQTEIWDVLVFKVLKDCQFTGWTSMPTFLLLFMYF